MAEPFPLVVCDAGPLIHLEELKSLDLLLSFGEIRVPITVWREVQRHQPSALRRRRVPLHRIEMIPEPTPELELLLRASPLDAGEAEAFRLMEQWPEATLLTDDAAARLLAQHRGYAVHGTLGVILRGLLYGIRTRRQVVNLLRAIPQRSTLHVTATLLREAIAQAREGAP